MADVKELNINNTTYDIKAKTVVDQNGGSLKYWTGTKAQYDAIVTKDSSTMYYLTDTHAIYLGDTLIVNLANRNIGEMIPSAIPLTDAGLHLLDGSLIQGNGIYSAFVTYISGLVATYPDLFITEAEWQQSVTDYGVCGKFVYDSVANTVRLPKITGILEGTTDVTAIGDLVEAGLPNITGNISWVTGVEGLAVSGVFSGNLHSYKTGHSSGNSTAGGTITFNASRSSSIYGNSSTVQPQTIKCYYYIVIATSTKTDIQVDIDEVVTDLNGKADVDLSNCTKPHVVETYVNGTSWYRVYSDGWCQQGGFCTGSTSYTVTFLKPFINTNYNPTVTFNYSHNATIMNMGCDTLTTNTMRININDGNQGSSRPVFWQACGYIR